MILNGFLFHYRAPFTRRDLYLEYESVFCGKLRADGIRAVRILLTCKNTVSRTHVMANMSLDRGRLLDVVTNAPPAWWNTVMPKFETNESKVERRWEALSGVSVGTTDLAICFPVHNERKGVRSSLAALLAGLIPLDARIHLIIVTNASRDGSAAVINGFLSAISETESIPAPKSLDEGLDARASRVTIGNLEISHYVTSTRGKANAQTLATRIAREFGTEFVVSLDSDSTIEPDAVALLYGRLKSFGSSATDDLPSVVFGSIHEQLKPGLGAPLVRALLAFRRTRAEQDRWAFHGALMGWQADWLLRHGGMPQCIIEDRAAAVMAHESDAKIGHSTGATWVYHPSDPYELLGVRKRFIRGAHQLLTKFPSEKARRFLSEMYPDIVPAFSERREKFFDGLVSEPGVFRRAIRCARFVGMELLIRLAKRDAARLKNESNWEAATSSK